MRLAVHLDSMTEDIASRIVSSAVTMSASDKQTFAMEMTTAETIQMKIKSFAVSF